MAKNGWSAALSLNFPTKKIIGLSASLQYHSYLNDDARFEKDLNSVGNTNYTSGYYYTSTSSSSWQLIGLFVGPYFRIIRDEFISLNVTTKVGILSLTSPKINVFEVITNGSIREVSNLGSSSSGLIGGSIGCDLKNKLSDRFNLLFTMGLLIVHGDATVDRPFPRPTYSRSPYPATSGIEVEKVNYGMTLLSINAGIGVSYSF
jgi:hypothetical protein